MKRRIDEFNAVGWIVMILWALALVTIAFQGWEDADVCTVIAADRPDVTVVTMGDDSGEPV